MKVEVILPAAGVGRRLNTSSPKALVLLNSHPLIAHTLKVFEKNSLVDRVIVAGHESSLGAIEALVKEYKFAKVKRVVAGGKTRGDSVKNGLSILDDDTRLVVIHDAARPFLSGDVLKHSIRSAERHHAVIVAVPVKSTMKKVDLASMTVVETLNRESIWEVQTPQVFKKEIILKAHRKRQESDPTDDALLVERLGIKVHIVRGEYRNIKITTQEDLLAAEAFLRKDV